MIRKVEKAKKGGQRRGAARDICRQRIALRRQDACDCHSFPVHWPRQPPPNIKAIFYLPDTFSPTLGRGRRVGKNHWFFPNIHIFARLHVLTRCATPLNPYIDIYLHEYLLYSIHCSTVPQNIYSFVSHTICCQLPPTLFFFIFTTYYLL